MKKTLMSRRTTPAPKPYCAVTRHPGMTTRRSPGLSFRGDGLLRNTVSAQALPVTVVNSASFATDKVVGPDSIATAFSNFVTQNNQQFFAQSQPLPTTLGGVSVQVGGTPAGLYYASPTQINFQVPPDLADNPAAAI